MAKDEVVKENEEIESKAPPAEGLEPAERSAESGSEEKIPDSSEPLPPKEEGEAEKKDWRDKRIAKLTAKLREEQEKNAAPKSEAAGSPDPTEDFNRRVAEAANSQVALADFNRRCNEEAAKGAEAFEDFGEKIQELRKIVNEKDPEEVAAYNQFLQAGLETGELAKLIYELGSDLNEATRILALPPLKMGIELAKRALAGAPSPEEVSKLPKPIRPLSARHTDPIDPTDKDRADSLSTAQWMKARESQLKREGAR